MNPMNKTIMEINSLFGGDGSNDAKLRVVLEQFLGQEIPETCESKAAILKRYRREHKELEELKTKMLTGKK